MICWRNGPRRRWKQSPDAAEGGPPVNAGSMIERGVSCSQQPRHLRKRDAQVLMYCRQAPPQLVNNFLEGCALASQSPRQRSRAHGQFLRNIVLALCRAAATFGPRFQPKRVGSPAVSRPWPPVANGSKGSSKWMSSVMRHRETLIGENELIGRPATRPTAAEPLKLRKPELRVDKGYFVANIPA
jgi:hypothetical protein